MLHQKCCRTGQHHTQTVAEAFAHLARHVRNRTSPIVRRGSRRVPLSIVELRLILRLLILWCWCIPTALHGLVAVLLLPSNLLLAPILWLTSVLLLAIGLLTIAWLRLTISLLVLLIVSLLRPAAAAAAARNQVFHLAC